MGDATDSWNVLYNNSLMTVVANERVSMAAVCTKTDKWIVKKKHYTIKEPVTACLCSLIWYGAGDRASVFLEAIWVVAEKDKTILIDL